MAASVASFSRVLSVGGSTAMIAVTIATAAVAQDVAADRAARNRCAQLVEGHGTFDVPPAYQAVSEPGRMIVSRRADGSEVHPARADVARAGFRIETTPTDNFAILPLERMSATRMQSGTVYSRVECEGLSCLFEAAFVPSTEAAVAVQCGAAPTYLRVVGATDRGFATARRLIRFRWGSQTEESIPLAQLGSGH